MATTKIPTAMVTGIAVDTYIYPEEFAEGVATGGDDSAAVQAVYDSGMIPRYTQAHYKLETPIKIPNNGYFQGEGIPKNGLLPRITGAENGSFLFTRLTGGSLETYVGGVRVKDLWFDGEHERPPGNYPWTTYAGDVRGPLSAWSFSADPNNPDAFSELIGCKFTRFASYPYQFYNFRHHNLALNCEWDRTKDPGYVNCASPQFINPRVSFSADNGVSISRGCTDYVVMGGIFKDCALSAIFAAGYNVPLAGTVTISGDYSVGGEVNLLASASTFLALYEDMYITARDGSGNEGVVRINACPTSTTAATATVVKEIPAGLQAIASTSWYWGPQNGPTSGIIGPNTIIGGGVSSVQLTTAAKMGTVGPLTLDRPGWCRDSEVHTVGSIEAGTDQLEVASATNFVEPCYVLIDPLDAQRPYHIARVSDITDGVMTLTEDCPRTYTDDPVYLLHAGDAGQNGYSVFVQGHSVGGHEYAEDLLISGLNIKNNYGNMFQLGNSGAGSVRRITVENIKHVQETALGLSGRQMFRMTEMEGYPSSLHVRNFETNDTAKFFEGYQHEADGVATVRRDWTFDNIHAPNIGIANLISATAQRPVDADEDVSHLYKISRTGRDSIPNISGFKYPEIVDVTDAAGVITVNDGFIAFTPGSANVDITQFKLGPAFSTTGNLEFIFRNKHASNTVTLKRNAGLLQVGADLVMPGLSQVKLVFLNPNLAGVL